VPIASDGKPRLGVGYSCLISSNDRATPGALAFLLDAIGRFHVIVYPSGMDATNADAAQLQGRVFVLFRDFFERECHPNPAQATIDVCSLIEFTAHRPERLALRIEDGVIAHMPGEDWPSAENLAERFDLLLGRRVPRWSPDES